VQQDREPPSRFGIGNPSAPAGVFAGGLGRRDRQAGSGARWHEPDRAALAGRFRVLDRAENAVRQAADADGARNAARRLLDVRPEWPERRFAGPRPDGSAPILRGSNRNTGQSLPVATYNGCTAEGVVRIRRDQPRRSRRASHLNQVTRSTAHPSDSNRFVNPLSGSVPLRAGGAVCGNHMARPTRVSPWWDR